MHEELRRTNKKVTVGPSRRCSHKTDNQQNFSAPHVVHQCKHTTFASFKLHLLKLSVALDTHFIRTSLLFKLIPACRCAGSFLQHKASNMLRLQTVTSGAAIEYWQGVCIIFVCVGVCNCAVLVSHILQLKKTL